MFLCVLDFVDCAHEIGLCAGSEGSQESANVWCHLKILLAGIRSVLKFGHLKQPFPYGVLVQREQKTEIKKEKPA